MGWRGGLTGQSHSQFSLFTVKSEKATTALQVEGQNMTKPVEYLPNTLVAYRSTLRRLCLELQASEAGEAALSAKYVAGLKAHFEKTRGQDRLSSQQTQGPGETRSGRISGGRP
jgi:hypothetical protein